MGWLLFLINKLKNISYIQFFREIRTEQEREKALIEENKGLYLKHKGFQKKFEEIDVKFNEAVKDYMLKSKVIKEKVAAEEKILNATSDKMQKAMAILNEMNFAEDPENKEN